MNSLNLQPQANLNKKYNEYSYFEALYRAFYSQDLYVDVAKNWSGFGIIYLLLVCFIISIPWSFKTYFKINDYYHNHVIPSVAKLPLLAIKNGDISIVTKPPLSSISHQVIYDDIDHQPFIEIDTSGKKISIVQSKAKILITKDKIMATLPSSANPQVASFDKKMNGYITSKELLEILNNSKRILILSIFPVTLVLIFISQFFALYMFCFIGIFLSQVFFNQKVTIRQSLRICCVAATFELLLSGVLYFLTEISKFTGLILFTCLFLYYVYGVRAYKNSMKKLVIS